MLISLLLAAIIPAAAAPAPIAGMHYLAGPWKCTYRAGATRLDYTATWVYDLSGRTLRQINTFAGGSDEELLAYNSKRGWTGVVVDDQGTATILRGSGKDPNHVAFHSVYPDASIAETFDRISATQYDLHATVRSGGKTMTSADTCLRAGR